MKRKIKDDQQPEFDVLSGTEPADFGIGETAASPDIQPDIQPDKNEGLPLDVPTQFLRALLDMAVINGRGWYGVIRNQAVNLGQAVSALPFLTMIFLGASFLVCVSVILPWLNYKVVLLGPQPESVGIGTAYKLFFFLPGAYGLFIGVFGFPRRAAIYYVLVVLATIAYAVGIFYPGLVHTSMLKESDFTFTLWLHLYGVFLGAAGLLAMRGALEKAIFDVQDLIGLVRSEPREKLFESQPRS